MQSDNGAVSCTTTASRTLALPPRSPRRSPTVRRMVPSAASSRLAAPTQPPTVLPRCWDQLWIGCLSQGFGAMSPDRQPYHRMLQRCQQLRPQRHRRADHWCGHNFIFPGDTDSIANHVHLHCYVLESHSLRPLHFLPLHSILLSPPSAFTPPPTPLPGIRNTTLFFPCTVEYCTIQWRSAPE